MADYKACDLPRTLCIYPKHAECSYCRYAVEPIKTYVQNFSSTVLGPCSHACTKEYQERLKSTVLSGLGDACCHLMMLAFAASGCLHWTCIELALTSKLINNDRVSKAERTITERRAMEHLSRLKSLISTTTTRTSTSLASHHIAKEYVDLRNYSSTSHHIRKLYFQKKSPTRSTSALWLLRALPLRQLHTSTLISTRLFCASSAQRRKLPHQFHRPSLRFLPCSTSSTWQTPWTDQPELSKMVWRAEST